MGQNASARAIAPSAEQPLEPQSTVLLSKSSLMPGSITLDLSQLPLTREQEVMSAVKGNFVDADPAEAKPRLADQLPRSVVIEPAGVTEQDVVEPKRVLDSVPLKKRLALTPPVWKIESTFKLKRTEKQKVVAQRRIRLAEENCLAKAVYFEARSETELGQLAVAKVILNRVKDPEYPKTICGVVYQGSDRRNSCQFSFACDGMADDVRSPAAWARSKRVAQKAITGDQTVRIMGAATHYHADYVRPKWSRDMRRLIKIGRHIFYSDT